MIRPMLRLTAMRNLRRAADPDALSVFREGLACIPARERGPELVPLGRGSNLPWDKRVLDLMVAVPVLVAALPIMLVAAAVIRIASPGPALFRQVRIGHGERPFMMLKLRTMRVDGDDSAFRERNIQEIIGQADPGSDGIFKAADDERIVPGGAFLRRYSIDELPQLLNVVRGEMSLVGPRPSLPWEVALYTAEQRRRHECPPGMTGLWQVSGRNRLSVQQMLELDLIYVRRRSLRLDLWILWRTLPAVLLGNDTH
jgi:lipopolysaccharide/colanic/teichoic acid biosynthesis glycosyltransferase